MIGYTEAELLGKSFDDITHGADIAKSHGFREALLTEKHGSPCELEKRYIHKDGSIVWVAIGACVVRDAGDADYFVTVIQDITRRKRAEQALQESKEQFQQLAKHVPEAFWITDLKRHAMIYVSPAFERIHGAPLRSMRSVWRAWKDTLHPEDRDRALEAHGRMACGPVDVQYRIVRPDGVTRWVRACGYPVENSRGVVYRVAGTIEDITERRELESRLHTQAHFDSLTGLPNRVLFFDRFEPGAGALAAFIARSRTAVLRYRPFQDRQRYARASRRRQAAAARRFVPRARRESRGQRRPCRRGRIRHHSPEDRQARACGAHRAEGAEPSCGAVAARCA